MNIDLQTIINARGFGSAETLLKKAGHWDEYAGQSPREFRVTVEYEVRSDCRETVTVNARCKAEAEELACKRVEEACDYEVQFNLFEATDTTEASA